MMEEKKEMKDLVLLPKKNQKEHHIHHLDCPWSLPCYNKHLNNLD